MDDRETETYNAMILKFRQESTEDLESCWQTLTRKLESK